MKYYPVFLRVVGRPCAVVGGGPIGERKALSLLEAGGRVTVISPDLTEGLAAQAATGALTHWARPYRSGDVRTFFLVCAATDDRALQAAVAAEADAAGVLVNVVDRPDLCTFILPSLLTRGDLTVAVSTGGGSPALARRVRQDIERGLGPEYEQALRILARLRAYLRETAEPAERQRCLSALVDSELLECLRAGDHAAIDRLLTRHAGDAVSLASLGVVLDE